MVRAVTFILHRPPGEILMHLRDSGGNKKILYPNMWTFPGGTLEGNEDPLRAVVREVKEEFGIDIKPGDCEFITSFDHDGGDDRIFGCGVPADTSVQLGEGAAFQWMTMSEIRELDKLAWHQNEILDTIEEYLRCIYSRR